MAEPEPIEPLPDVDEPRLEDETGAPIEGETRRRSFLSRWVEVRAEKAIRSAVSSGAEKIEERAAQVVGTLYDKKADDLEERAVRAMRRAIAEESERIRQVIEHSVEVKRREVRLSLLVLVGAAVVYLVLYWLTQEPPPAS